MIGYLYWPRDFLYQYQVYLHFIIIKNSSQFVAVGKSSHSSKNEPQL